jgi:hypothetical protein
MYLYRGMSDLELISWEDPNYRNREIIPARKDFTASASEAIEFAKENILCGKVIIVQFKYNDMYFDQTYCSSHYLLNYNWYMTSKSFFIDELEHRILSPLEAVKSYYSDCKKNV